MNTTNNSPRCKRRASRRRYIQSRTDANAVSCSDCTPIFIGGRQIGEVCGEEFIKRIMGSKHILRSLHAIAFDMDCLEQAIRAGARIARVIDQETNTHYRVMIPTILEEGIPVNYGYGRQLALPLQRWTIGAGFAPDNYKNKVENYEAINVE